MEFRALKYFLTVAQEENITKAAQILHVTQPTLSRQMMNLEEELGVALFQRGRYQTVLTEEGVIFRQRAQEIVDEIYSHAQYTVADAEQLSSGDLAVEVTVSPIEIIPLLTEDQMAAAWTSVKQASGASDEAIAAMSDEEYQVLDEQYANALLDQLEALIPQLTYGQDQVIMLQMKEEDGYYSLVDSGMQKLDEVMIDYYGAYA